MWPPDTVASGPYRRGTLRESVHGPGERPAKGHREAGLSRCAKRMITR